MDRTQKKCVIASTGAHLLLALILIIGPAFGSSKSKVDELPLLDFVPVKTVDALMSGGGYRDGQPPVAAPAPQQPQPAPAQPKPVVRQPDPEPPKPSPKEDPTPKPDLKPKEEPKPKEDSESLVPSTKPRHKVEINTNLVVRKRDADSAKAKAEAQARQQAREMAESRRQLARQIGKIADRIGEEASGTTSIRLLGPGGGGVPYANFLQAVKTVYANAWVVPDGMTDDRAVAVASVTIAKDGHVVKAEIIRHSGNALVDQSVRATLDRVKFAAPLPDDARESERTVSINFDVRAKQGIG